MRLFVALTVARAWREVDVVDGHVSRVLRTGWMRHRLVNESYKKFHSFDYSLLNPTNEKRTVLIRRGIGHVTGLPLAARWIRWEPHLLFDLKCENYANFIQIVSTKNSNYVDNFAEIGRRIEHRMERRPGLLAVFQIRCGHFTFFGRWQEDAVDDGGATVTRPPPSVDGQQLHPQ